MSNVLHLGDCRSILTTIDDNTIDSIVTDPPYELGFMGKAWDNSGIAYDVTVWQQCLRVLKPGGHLLAFGGSRTYHRMAVAIEDAGFDIRDQIMWIYGSGFPKSLNIGKAMDKKAGIWRGRAGAPQENDEKIRFGQHYERNPIEPPVTDSAKTWDGWGTALKPAHEPICVARKPLIGTVADNVLAYGVGGINIDGCRVEYKSTADMLSATPGGKVTVNKVGNVPDIANNGRKGITRPDYSKGRWPANIIFDEAAGQILDEQSGGASRFFYCPKSASSEREKGLEDFDKVIAGAMKANQKGELGNGKIVYNKNSHPTVKPIQLMQYLLRLVTPLNGIVLDPFMGSGSTGCAAVLEGFNFIGIDITPEYVVLADKRIKHYSIESFMGTMKD